MANQSLVSIPPDLEDPTVLRRFLARLVEQLDIVVGNKAAPQQQYINQKQFKQLNLELRETLAAAQSELEEILAINNNTEENNISALDNRISALENEAYNTDNYGVVTNAERV